MFFITKFTRSLKLDIAALVQSHLPQTNVRIAKIQETLMDKHKFRFSCSLASFRSQLSNPSKSNNRINSPPSSVLSKERQKRDYRRANNLCFYCSEPFYPAHLAKCAKRPKAKVNELVVNDLYVTLTDDILQQLDMEDALTSEFGHLSLNAIAGTDKGQTLK